MFLVNFCINPSSSSPCVARAGNYLQSSVSGGNSTPDTSRAEGSKLLQPYLIIMDSSHSVIVEEMGTINQCSLERLKAENMS